jgi:hypothetical protein
MSLCIVSRLIPDSHKGMRTRPLRALVVGSYVRGLSDQDIESLVEEAVLGSPNSAGLASSQRLTPEPPNMPSLRSSTFASLFQHSRDATVA